MDDVSTIHILGGPSQLQRVQDKTRKASAVYLVRPELSAILNVYGRMVAAGEWHDYAIDMLPDRAIFSIFRRASERPMYSIIKEPANAAKQGMWRITGMEGQILKRGKDLKTLLRYFDRQLLKAVT